MSAKVANMTSERNAWRNCERTSEGSRGGHVASPIATKTCLSRLHTNPMSERGPWQQVSFPAGSTGRRWKFYKTQKSGKPVKSSVFGLKVKCSIVEKALIMPKCDQQQHELVRDRVVSVKLHEFKQTSTMRWVFVVLIRTQSHTDLGSMAEGCAGILRARRAFDRNSGHPKEHYNVLREHEHIARERRCGGDEKNANLLTYSHIPKTIRLYVLEMYWKITESSNLRNTTTISQEAFRAFATRTLRERKCSCFISNKDDPNVCWFVNCLFLVFSWVIHSLVTVAAITLRNMLDDAYCRIPTQTLSGRLLNTQVRIWDEYETNTCDEQTTHFLYSQHCIQWTFAFSERL